LESFFSSKKKLRSSMMPAACLLFSDYETISHLMQSLIKISPLSRE